MSAIMFPCKFHQPCRVYTCRKMAKFYIGHPNTLSNCEAYCEECARSIAASIPPEFIPGAEDLVQKGREEAMAAFQEQQAGILETVRSQSEEIQKLTIELLAAKSNPVDLPFSDPDEDDPEEGQADMFDYTDAAAMDGDDAANDENDEASDEEPAGDDDETPADEPAADSDDVTYACLDCPDLEPFKTKAGLTRHRNKHHA